MKDNVTFGGLLLFMFFWELTGGIVRPFVHGFIQGLMQ